MDRFSKYNPKSTFLFFIFTLILNLVTFHPVYLVLSLAGGLAYKFKLNGKTVFSYLLKFILPVVILVSVFNFIFTHYGETVIFTLNDTAFTFESLFYGFCQGVMLAGVIVWFSNYSQVVTSERFLSVFGNVMPNTALIFSTVLGFIPRMKNNFMQIKDARHLLDTDKSKFKKSVEIFSAVVTMTLEESISLADSMKARGFSSGRKVYSKYRFNGKDLFLLAFTLLTGVCVCVFKAVGEISFIYEPVIEMQKMNLLPLLVYAVFLFLPVIIDVTEDMRWHILKQKI